MLAIEGRAHKMNMNRREFQIGGATAFGAWGALAAVTGGMSGFPARADEGAPATAATKAPQEPAPALLTPYKITDPVDPI